MKRALAAALVLAPLASCVLADPPPTLPIVAEGPPTILPGATPEASVLTTWPREFVIPVFVVDPTRTLEWIALVYPGSTYPVDEMDEFPILPDGQPVQVTPGIDAGQTFAIHVAGVSEPDGPGCFTVEVIVGYIFNGITPVSPPGGAVASWIYSSSGGVEGCASYDGGSLGDGTFPDASPSIGSGG